MKQFLSKGNSVVATARNVEKASELQRLAGESNGRLTIASLDVADPASIEKFPSAVPFDHVDVLINNAGVYRGERALEDTNADVLIDTFRTNTVGPLLVVKAMLGAGKIGGSQKSIVANVTSKMGSIDDNGSGGSYAYRASKCALNIVTKSLSIDMESKNVDTILLHPGWVKTDMTRQSGLITDVQSVEVRWRSAFLRNHHSLTHTHSLSVSRSQGMISVLEDQPVLNGKWFDYKHEAIPW